MSTPFRRLLRATWRNLAIAGMTLSPVIPAEFARVACRPPGAAGIPEYAWPERLVPAVELTPDERLLWAQLEGLDR
jgi:hypothetical protein